MLLAADFSLMCRLPSASVLIGQDAVMTNPALHETLGQGVPGPAGLVGEHDRHDAVGLDDPAALGEDRGHPLLVVAAGELPWACFWPRNRNGLAMASWSLSVR